MTVVVWFRRDLRLRDHGALAEAASREEPVVPVFVLDPRLANVGARRQARLLASLAHLDQGIRAAGGAGLLVVRDDPRGVLPAVAREHKAREVLVSQDHAPYGRARDAAVAERLQADGARLVPADSPYLHRPGTIRKADGSAFSVYTPYWRTWRSLPIPSVAASAPVRFARVSRPDLPELADAPGRSAAGDHRTSGEDPADMAGEDHADVLLNRFVRAALAGYGNDRNRPDLAATSGLSAALHFGEIHPRTVVQQVQAAEGRAPEPYLRQITWRDFYADVLHRRPELAWTSLDARWDGFAWRTDARARQDFDVWCRGRTGYPFVDAGMRQLLQTGWMHNRARMATASFLTKDLMIPWQWGARWFLQHLVDGDIANNNLGWQWVAGTGIDPAPFFRVFNPVTQGRRFDPAGAYVHRYVPELRGVSAPDVHEPGPRTGYPGPMVDHAQARREALAAYAAIQTSR